jgi:hypothetical protein
MDFRYDSYPFVSSNINAPPYPTAPVLYGAQNHIRLPSVPVPSFVLPARRFQDLKKYIGLISDVFIPIPTLSYHPKNGPTLPRI